jgi:hypothetical protein
MSERGSNLVVYLKLFTKRPLPPIQKTLLLNIQFLDHKNSFLNFFKTFFSALFHHLPINWVRDKSAHCVNYMLTNYQIIKPNT